MTLDTARDLSRPGDEFGSLPGFRHLAGEQRDVVIDIAGPHPTSGGQPLFAHFGDDQPPKGPDLLDEQGVDRGALAVEQRQHAV